MHVVMKYLSNVWRALWAIIVDIDKLLNAIALGDPDETISSRVGKRRDGAERFWAWVVDKLFFWQKNHTKKSVQPDEGGDSVA